MKSIPQLKINKLTVFLALGFTMILLMASCSKINHIETPSPTPEPTDPQLNPELITFGPYFAGKTVYEWVDESRDNRPVSITVFYPALLPKGDSHFYIEKDRDPDYKNAPYPAILSSTKVANQFAPYLVSQGFTWIGVNNIDTYMKLSQEIYQQPLDLLFALNKVAENPPAGLEGMINTDMVGAMGYSFDGNNTLTLNGARIDSSLYLSHCDDPENLPDWGAMSCFSCDPAYEWDTFTANAEKILTIDQDGIWQAITDERIKAFIPMATEGYWLFDFSSIDRPILMIAGSDDPLYAENALIFEDLNLQDKTFITILNEEHMMIYDPDIVAKLAHFATAFFGYYLQGNENSAHYFSKDYVSLFDELQWGIVNEK